MRIKRNTILVFIAILAVTSCNADDSSLNFSTVNSAIAKFKNIELDNAFKKVEINLSGFSSEGGILNAYINSEDIVQFFEGTLFFETGKIVSKYYNVGSDLAVYYITIVKYSKPITEPNSEVIETSTDQYVIKDGESIYKYNTNSKEYDTTDTNTYYAMIVNFLELIGSSVH